MNLFTTVCFLKMLWRTAFSGWFWGGLLSGEVIYISGHDFQEQADDSIICEVCGAKSKHISYL